MDLMGQKKGFGKVIGKLTGNEGEKTRRGRSNQII